ncbi:MAG: hypothetical protein MJ072_04770, partial [Clostridia bacterium]|nr:hypothetical protein [Clostridia bacterium]
VLLSFYLAFGRYGIGTFLSRSISAFSDAVITGVEGLLYIRCSEFTVRLICEGLLDGMKTVLAFIPQIGTLTVCTAFLDQSGIISKLSLLSDKTLKRFRLSGKAVYALFCGFGCSATACISSTGIEDETVKKRTILSLPFITCSAKTPIYTFLAQCGFKENCFWVLSIIYLLSFPLAMIHSTVLKKTVIRSADEPMICEIADFRFPSVKTLAKSLLKTLKEFIIKLSTIIVVVSVSLWLLKSVSTDFTLLPLGVYEGSLLLCIGKFIAPLFYPLGITDWRISVSMLSGIFAKEGILSAIAILFPEGLSVNVAQGIALIAFSYLYTPCVTSLISFSNQIGWRYSIICAVYQLISALIVSYIIYFCLTVLL